MLRSKLLKSITTIVKENENKPNGFPYLHDLLKYYKVEKKNFSFKK
jgi:hypothetical protein